LNAGRKKIGMQAEVVNGKSVFLVNLEAYPPGWSGAFPVWHAQSD